MSFLRKFVLVLAFASIAGPALAARCADYTDCREAVVEWCEGRHSRADGDGDGIPCENVCGSRDQVVEIMRQIGCDR